jgi:hypothetical protein
MSAAMNLLRANPATKPWILSHGFTVFRAIQQLAGDNTNFVKVNYPMWTWATSVTTMPAGY